MTWRNEYSVIVENMILGLTGELPGNKFYFDPTKGSDGGDGTRQSPFKTLANGYAQLRDGYNDVLYFIPGASPVPLTASFVWAKNYAHLLGLAGPGVYGGRCRIHDSAAFAGILFSILGAKGCIFKNIHWQRDFDSAIGVENVTIGAGSSYNYFEDCQFDSPIMASLGAATYRNLSGAGANGSNTFRRCTIGQWNQQASSANGRQLYLAGEETSWNFMDCVFMWNTTSASMKPIEIVDLTSEYVYTLFDRCKFLGLGTSVTGLCASGTPAHGKTIFIDCRTVGVDEYDAGTNTRIWLANGTAVSGELGGKAIQIA
jgi:hypothetical protein